MAIDFTKPVATADRTQNLTDTKDTLVAVAKQLDDTTPTGVATGMIRWSSTNNKWQKYNGSSWVDLASTFAINVSSFGGQAASYYTNIAARLGYTPLNKAGDTMTGALTLNAAPTSNLHASTKKYVDDGLAGKANTSHTHAVLFAEGALTESADAFNYPVLLTNVGTPDANNYWFVTTTRRDVTNVGQTAVGLGNGRMYTRSKKSGSWWTAWVRCDLGEGLTRSIGASGYAKIPGAGGLMIQWGVTGSIVFYGMLTVTLPVAFPTACVSVTTALVNSTISSSTGGSAVVASVSAASFDLRNTHDSSSAVRWIALGY